MDAKITGGATAAPEQANDKPRKSKKAKRKYKRSVAPGKQTGSEEARRVAAAVLEVLAGERRPSEAAAVLGVSIMRYYILESRALQGLVDGCEPRPIGPRKDPTRVVAKLERRIESLTRETVRYQALARASHRAVGIAPVKITKPKKGKPKRRKPTVRALKAARTMRAGAPAQAAGGTPPAAAKP